MHHNILDYWQALENLPEGHSDRPSPRVCRVLQRVFEEWQSKPPWPEPDTFGTIFDGLSATEIESTSALPVAERKAIAIARMLERVLDDDLRINFRTAEIRSDELVVGTMPPYSVGQGKELVRYLTEEEALRFQLQFLNEWSPFGHTVPDHGPILTRGIDALIVDCEERLEALENSEDSRRSFYNSVIGALRAVIDFAAGYAELAIAAAERHAEDSPRRGELEDIAARLRHSPASPPRDFREAVQCVHIVHCALHWTGEIVPLGRLDQLLHPFYEADIEAGSIVPEEAQEWIDLLWLKLDEKVILDRRHAEDRFTDADGALVGTGAPSNFDQGALLNQWMQQVTIGGWAANDDPEPTDATNAVSLMCLEAARRLPVNSPTLDLRVHRETTDEILQAAARALLSGGAHPVLLNDESIVPALHAAGDGAVALRSARNYASDGCYEPLFAGETEFSFGLVSAMDALEKTMNSGGGFAFSGGTYLRGMKGAMRTPAADRIGGFEEFEAILREHIALGCHRFLHGVLEFYGCKEPVSPSPMLSALIDGCIETGRDLSGGGARHKLFAPLMTGISTAADSLYVIKHLVFEQQQVALDELVACLRTNWGTTDELIGRSVTAERIREIRDLCMAQRKFGHGDEAVDDLAWQLVEWFDEAVHTTRHDPVHEAGWQRLRERYGDEDHPFDIILVPGVGTFEQYVFGGAFVGASPDGRTAFAPLASDMSPAPLHPDEEPVVAGDAGRDGEIGAEPGVQHARQSPLRAALRTYGDPRVHRLSNGAPADLNIREDFPENDLVEAIRTFAAGDGGNVLTVTVANPETLQAAVNDPESFNLVRVRMGGWTEFFVTLFPAHKEQHRRRPLYTP